MKKIILTVLSALVLFSFGSSVSADKKEVAINIGFDVSKMPKQIKVGETGQFSAPFIGGKSQGYDLEAITSFQSEEPSILKVSADGSFQALKAGEVVVFFDYKIPQSGYDKYPDVNFSFTEPVLGVVIEVVEEQPTPAVVGKELPATVESTAPPQTSTTAAPAPTTVPTGAVAKTAYHKENRTLLPLFALLLTSACVILVSLRYKK